MNRPIHHAIGAGVLAILVAGCHEEHTARPASPAKGGIARPVAATGHFAPAVAPAAGSLDYLARYVGKTPKDSGLFESRPLDGRLRALLGTDYGRFIAAMPEARLSVEDGIYALYGKTEQGVAAIVMDPRADSVYAIEQDRSGRREYLERSIKPPLPAAVRALIASVPLR